MQVIRPTRTTAVAAVCLLTISCAWVAFGASYELKILPAERKQTTDRDTGAQLVFLTTHLGSDTNLYFHERSWLSDGSLIVFISDRDPQERPATMGYLVATGELVRLSTPQGGISRVSAAVSRPAIYGMRGRDVLELSLSITPSSDPAVRPSRVIATERVISTLPQAMMRGLASSLNENCNGKKLCIGVTGPTIITIDVKTGAIAEVCRILDPPGYGSHTQWSHTDPHLISFAGRPNRLMVVDVREGKPWPAYKEWDDELATHEHWWVDNQLVFCGGIHPEPNEDRHVKAVNVHTGVVRIVGAGAWWPDGSDEAIAKQNFWHCAGSDDGRWVVADNWHGDITLFEGTTTRPRVLTTGHRSYGTGEHPHVGWDRDGKQVVFTSHKLGNPNVCIATIPQAWQEANPARE